jgi:hypothetical protein
VGLEMNAMEIKRGALPLISQHVTNAPVHSGADWSTLESNRDATVHDRQPRSHHEIYLLNVETTLRIERSVFRPLPEHV